MVGGGGDRANGTYQSHLAHSHSITPSLYHTHVYIMYAAQTLQTKQNRIVDDPFLMTYVGELRRRMREQVRARLTPADHHHTKYPRPFPPSSHTFITHPSHITRTGASELC